MGTQSLVEVGPLYSKTKSLGCLWFSNSQDKGRCIFPTDQSAVGPCVCYLCLSLEASWMIASPFVLDAGGALCAPHWICGFCGYLFCFFPNTMIVS